ncbi:MAG: FAD-dependent oxidoreductase [Alphaproteobacteria bacterium]
MSRRVIVVGGGPAGVAAAIAARRTAADAEVVLLSAEALKPYEKPPLSKAVLTENLDPSATPIVPDDLLAGIDLRLGVRVAGIDRAGRRVDCGAGGWLTYDALVLATGAGARTLPGLPATLPGVHYLRDAADALRLRDALGQARSVAVVGAGLIGLEVAAAAAVGGAAVTVLEAAATAMARVCAPSLAQRIVERHVRAGVMFRWGAAVRGVKAVADKLALSLGDGETLSADLVVVGIGIQPDTALAEATGLAVARGIVVDATCRSADSAIFAAGDVARFRTLWCDGPVALENWRHALDQGEAAGINAAGGDATYAAVPSFWSDQYEVRLQGVGWADGLETPAVRRALAKDGAIEFHLRDGQVRYAVGIGASREIAIAKRLIERRIAVQAEALADPGVALAGLLRASA